MRSGSRATLSSLGVLATVLALSGAAAPASAQSGPQVGGHDRATTVMPVEEDPAGSYVALSAAQRATLGRLMGAPMTVAATLAVLRCPVERLNVTTVVLPLSGGQTVTFVRTRPAFQLDGGVTWRGELVETGEPAFLMLWGDGSISGYFAYNGRVFAVEQMGDGLHSVAELKEPPVHAPPPESRADDSRLRASPAARDAARPGLPRPARPEPVIEPLSDARRLALEAKPITIDVMLLYTRRVAARYVGDVAVRLPFVIEFSNQTFENSGLGNIRLRLVHSQLVDFDEAGTEHFDIVYGMVDGTGPFRGLRKLRDEKRADIVGMLVDDPRGCGLSTRVGADSDEAFFVVHHSCSVVTYSVAHEIGHILGARHDRSVDDSDTPFPYGHGHVDRENNWRTIMSYNEGCGGCRRIPYWSNPRVLYKGRPTGTLANDNARVILEQAERVAGFR